MLVLSRKKQESIVICDGENVISIRILGVRGSAVKVGIVAPENISVHRAELPGRVRRANLVAGALAAHSGSVAMQPVPWRQHAE